MLPMTVAYYKKRFPDCRITILDNESSDRSVEIAVGLGCHIHSFSSENIMNEFVLQEVRNSCFQNVESGWVIVADMDEWLDACQDDLDQEKQSGCTVLKTIGYDMVGDSETNDLSDISLDSIVEGTIWNGGDKRMCFLRPDITRMNYCYGGHKCTPEGNVVYSEKTYLIRHMSFVGEEFLINKYRQRYERTHIMRTYGLDDHYTDDSERVRALYREKKADRQNVYSLLT